MEATGPGGWQEGSETLTFQGAQGRWGAQRLGQLRLGQGWGAGMSNIHLPPLHCTSVFPPMKWDSSFNVQGGRGSFPQTWSQPTHCSWAFWRHRGFGGDCLKGWGSQGQLGLHTEREERW